MVNKCGVCQCVIIAQDYRVVCYSCEDDGSMNGSFVEYDADHHRWFLDGL